MFQRRECLCLWILRRRGSMQNAVYPGATPVPLPMEKPLVLRYRLVIHRGAVQLEQISFQVSLASLPKGS